jgi:hypothetical protein
VPASEYSCAKELRALREAFKTSPRGDGRRRAARQTADGQAVAQSPKRDTDAFSAARSLSGVNGTERSRTPTVSAHLCIEKRAALLAMQS